MVQMRLRDCRTQATTESIRMQTGTFSNASVTEVNAIRWCHAGNYLQFAAILYGFVRENNRVGNSVTIKKKIK